MIFRIIINASTTSVNGDHGSNSRRGRPEGARYGINVSTSGSMSLPATFPW